MQHRYILAFVFVLWSSCALVAQKELIQRQTFAKLLKNTPGIEEVCIAIPGEVQFEYWDKPYIRSALMVEAKGISRELMKSIVTTGRYRLEGIRIGQEYWIHANRLRKQIVVNGRRLSETYRINLKLPREVRVVRLDTGASLLPLEHF